MRSNLTASAINCNSPRIEDGSIATSGFLGRVLRLELKVFQLKRERCFEVRNNVGPQTIVLHPCQREFLINPPVPVRFHLKGESLLLNLAAARPSKDG